MTSTYAANPAPVLDVDQLASHVGEGLRRHAPQNVSRWFRRLVSVGSCSRPVRLKGSRVVQDVMGRELSRFSSTDEPDGVLLKACGDRRASRCPGCAYTYRGDAWQVIAAGLRGGKGVPDSAAGHPRVFLTVTAPSFGPVHTRRVNSTGVALRCHNGRPGQTCPHGRPTRCLSRHQDDDDPRVSQPLCPDCYDHDGQVLFNALATELWRRTTVYLTRALAAQVGMPYRRMLHWCGSATSRSPNTRPAGWCTSTPSSASTPTPTTSPTWPRRHPSSPPPRWPGPPPTPPAKSGYPSPRPPAGGTATPSAGAGNSTCTRSPTPPRAR